MNKLYLSILIGIFLISLTSAWGSLVLVNNTNISSVNLGSDALGARMGGNLSNFLVVKLTPNPNTINKYNLTGVTPIQTFNSNSGSSNSDAGVGTNNTAFFVLFDNTPRHIKVYNSAGTYQFNITNSSLDFNNKGLTVYDNNIYVSYENSIKKINLNGSSEAIPLTGCSLTGNNFIATDGNSWFMVGFDNDDNSSVCQTKFDGTFIKQYTISTIPDFEIDGINYVNSSLYLYDFQTGYAQRYMLSNYSATYNSLTTESSLEQFSLNYIISQDIISTSAILNYNGSNYTSTVNCDGLYCTATNSLNIPFITSSGNMSFYWNIINYNSTEVISELTNTYNQTVNPITLTYCNSGVRVLNYTLYDEQNRTRLYNFTFDATFEYSTGGGNRKVLTISNQSTSEVNLCINVNTTYYLDAIIAYSKNGYTLRNWFYQNYPVNNVTKNVSMYSLLSSASTSFILQIQDRNLQAVPNFLIEAQRCYPGYNTNETVFIHRTDSSGLTTGNFEAETALYKFIITNNSEVITIIDNCDKVVPQTAPYTLIFQLGDDYQSPFNNIDDVTDLQSTIYFNTTSNTVTWTYIDTSNEFLYSNMTINYLNASGNSQPIVCSSSSTLSSSIINCNITRAGSYAINVRVYRTNEVVFDRTIITMSNISNTTGYYGVFIGFFITLIACFMFKYNEIAGIFAIIVVSWFNYFVGFINYGIPGLTAITAIGLIIVGVLER